MTRIALYPGSFDPPTRGHEDLILRGRQLADRVVVAVAVNSAKQPLFEVAERLELLRRALGGETGGGGATVGGLEFDAFEGLVADYARRIGATILLRGLRAVGDFEYELQMALMNRQLCPGLETVFLVPAQGLSYISASLVREVARYGGDVSALVHPAVADALRRRFCP
ncbi:MAG TPA: pantetheine-phosphate adenylyltransferase [Gemmatimonadales bacterium]|jgi:pantetheine-phosphate adenylyltransferase|nr:pantetheine-phosphate adenylyltransferase [Gemmatimonadales bacterium]